MKHIEIVNTPSLFIRRERLSALNTCQREGGRASSHSPLKGRALLSALGAALVVLVALIVLVACSAAPSGGVGPGGGTGYVCANGTPSSLRDATADGLTRCVSCNTGWYLRTAQQRCVNELLTNVHNVDDNDDVSLELLGASSVTTATIGDTPYLFVAGAIDNGVSVFSIATGGALTNVHNVTDDTTLALAGASSVTTATIGATPYLFVAGQSDNGVSVFSIATGGALTNVHNVTDDATLELIGAISVTTATIGDSSYLFVAGQNDSGVSVFSIANDGALTNVDNVDDNDDPTLALLFTRSVTTATIGATPYLFVAGAFDRGVSVFSIADGGTLTNVHQCDR